MNRTSSIMMLAVASLALTSCAPTEQKATSPATKSATAAASPTEDVEQTILKMERDWAEAIVKGDLAFSERILANDFSFIQSNGETLTKAPFLEMFKSGGYKITVLDLDNLKVRVFTDTAVASYGQTEKSTYQGKDTSGHYVYTDVWAKRNGKWQVISSQGTKTEEPKK